MKHTVTVYGPGGFDPSKPNGNVVEEVEVDVPDVPPDPRDVRLATLEAEVRGMRDRVEAVEVANADVQALRDAVRGPST